MKFSTFFFGVVILILLFYIAYLKVVSEYKIIGELSFSQNDETQGSVQFIVKVIPN